MPRKRSPLSIPKPPDNESFYQSFGDMAHGDRPDVPFVPGAMTRYIHPEVGADLTPEALSAIFLQANSGQTESQNKLSVEILERNPEIMSCYQVRVGALSGTDWSCEGEHAAEAEDMLSSVAGDADMGLLDFRQLIESCGNALLPGFAIHETCWDEGGGNIKGWYYLAPYYFTHRFFPGESSYNAPLLIRESTGFIRQSEPLLPKEKWVIHRNTGRGGDPARGGLVRPLAWLHLFHIGVMKNGLRYVEKFCQPFLLAQVALSDKVAFEAEVSKLRLMLNQMGTDTGAVFGNTTTITPVEVSGTGNAIYQQMLGTLSSMINRLMLGQTSTTTAENSNRSVGQVHNLVRHDLLVSDCRALETTVTQQILAPWVRYKYGQGVKPPQLRFDVTPYRDSAEMASVLKDLSAAGLEPEDMDEVSRIVGIKVRKAPKEAQDDPQATVQEAQA